MAKKTKKSLFFQIFPGFQGDQDEDTAAAALPVDVTFGSTYADDAANPHDAATQSGEEMPVWELPESRFARYDKYRTMSGDSTIGDALRMHVSHALSAKPDTGEIISIESTDDKENKYVLDLRNTFKENINKNAPAWAFLAAIYGVWYVRLYGDPGVGVKLIRSDYYTHPRHIRTFERAGQMVGYTSSYQSQNRGKITLIEPWKFGMFRIPRWNVNSNIEPTRLDGTTFDIGNDDYSIEGVIESENYGHSFLETAYNPWMDLMAAILSLNMSRKNAAMVERLIGVNTGKLSPTRAARYLNEIAGKLKNINEESARKATLRGYIQTVVNNLIPIWGDGRGRLEISTVEGNPNIDGLADLDFHIKRLGSALGIDPGLMGFGEMLSAGLGDGGFFRLSLNASMKADALRSAIQHGLENIFDIHVALKHNKVFLPGEKPWKLVFNSVSTAMEREDMENKEARGNFAMMLAGLAQTIDPEMTDMDKLAFKNFIWTDIVGIDEEQFRIMYPGRLELKRIQDELDKKNGVGAGNGDVPEDAGIYESAVKDKIAEFYESNA
jgi:Bacteriophage T4-like portal protein (Gp20)